MRTSSRRQWLAFCLILAGLAGAGVAVRARQSREKQPLREDRAAIELLLAAQVKAWNGGNVDEFLKGYWRSEELTFSGSGGISRGWDGVRRRYLETYPDRKAMGTLAFSELEMRALGRDDVLVLGRWQLQRETGDLGGVFTLIVERKPEAWRIVHDHTSSLAAKAPQ
jgi:beta-aspartyl-peptidase (threonine type)